MTQTLKLKLKLITPPDIFENNDAGLLFINLSEEEQTQVSVWLSQSNIQDSVNLYAYSGEENVSWLLYASKIANYTYINLNNNDTVTNSLGGYLLGNSSVFYKTDNAEVANVYGHINSNRVDNVTTFLERVLID
jgi:hypothetical protein